MSQIEIPTIETFPVEIIHRIFDNLDIETIFFFIRPISRLFRSIVLNYDRINFHTTKISKSRFNILCRMISPQYIRSLTLYNNDEILDQISLFLRQVRLRQLTNLQSIHLFGIDEFQLNYLFKRIHFDRLQSFSIQINKCDNRRRNSTVKSLSTIVQQSNLTKLQLDIKNIRISEILCSSNCSIECLTINGNIHIDDLIKIFSYSHQLHRLTINENLLSLINDNIRRSSFVQLKSLILEKIDVQINEIESFLLLTPSLVYLKLFGKCSIFNGKQWEDFIQVNLPQLDQFQFDIKCRDFNEKSNEDLQIIIQSFQSSFWIEHKKWFVAVEMDLNFAFYYRIYSIPICESICRYELNSDKVFLSTSNEIFEAKNINQISLRLKASLNKSTLKSMNIPYLSNVTKLHIDFDTKISIDLIKYLRKIINPLQLIEVNLESYSLNKNHQEILCDMLKFLKKSSKLSKLIIQSRFNGYEIYSYLERIFQYLPCQINHLKIPIKTIEQMKMILERCRNLTILQLETNKLKLSNEIKEWFEENTIDSIFRRANRCDTIWIGYQIQSFYFNHKRIKLNQK